MLLRYRKQQAADWVGNLKEQLERRRRMGRSHLQIRYFSYCQWAHALKAGERQLKWTLNHGLVFSAVHHNEVPAPLLVTIIEATPGGPLVQCIYLHSTTHVRIYDRTHWAECIQVPPFDNRLLWSLYFGIKQWDNSAEEFSHSSSLPWELEPISLTGTGAGGGCRECTWNVDVVWLTVLHRTWWRLHRT